MLTDILSLQAVFDYLGIDYADEMVTRRVTSLIAVADSYIVDAVGENYAQSLSIPQSKKVQELALMLIADLYDERGTTLKQASAKKHLFSSMLTQLQIAYEGANKA